VTNVTFNREAPAAAVEAYTGAKTLNMDKVHALIVWHENALKSSRWSCNDEGGGS